MTTKNPSTILVVDDELFGRKALGGLLAGQGYNLLYAKNGLETLEIAKQQIPDLILLDVVMPEMDGFEVCRRLRSDNVLSDIPIVMITALDNTESRLQGLEAGADDFITKPFNGIELRARIRTITRLNRYRRLLSERAKFQQTVEFSPNGIVIVDLKGNISLVNPAMLKMLQVENANSLLGDTFFQFVAEDSQEKCQKLLERGQKNPVLNQELLFVNSQKMNFPVEIDIGGFLLEDKAMLQVVVRDITEKKKLQTMLLNNQRQEILGTISGSIAHDLKNVLTPILIATEMLEAQVVDERGKRFTSMIKRSGNHGVLLVQQILKFSKGNKAKSSDTIELISLIEEIREIIGITLSKTVSFNAEVPSDLWPVIGDATQLHQVILNLCVNARDAMPEGGKLTISARNIYWENLPIETTAKPGNYVEIAVSDTGTGIASENLVHIFEPFFTTKSADKGTGLGLFTVQTIVRNHNGFLRVESTLNKGTTFLVYIPASKSIEAEEFFELPLGQGELVLIVNDEVSLGGMIKETLEGYGYNTLTANTLLETIVCYESCKEKKQKLDVVLLDISTSVNKAEEILQILKGLDQDIRVISIGNEHPKNADRNLPKPHNISELLSTLRHVLEKSNY